MITRYSRPEMRAIWTDENKLRIWLQIELLASKALAAEGTVPKADFAKMKPGTGRKAEQIDVPRGDVLTDVSGPHRESLVEQVVELAAEASAWHFLDGETLRPQAVGVDWQREA